MDEKLITFTKFNNEDALTFGLKVIEISKQENLKPLRIRVVKDDDIIFQYLMSGKTGVLWLDRKANTVIKTKRSSLFVYKHQEKFKEILNDENYAICGGGYPLIIDDQFRGVFCVSGLEHDQDHNLIVKVLKEMQKDI